MDLERLSRVVSIFKKAAEMKALIIDDAQERHEGLQNEYEEDYDIDHAYDYSSAINLLNSNTYDLICFDHDLNDFTDEGEKTGSSVARYMAYAGMKCRAARVHSHNPVGAKNIISILKSGDVSDNVWYEPFQISPGMRMVGLEKEVEE